MFKHRCQRYDGVNAMRPSVATRVPVNAAVAGLCRCGAVLDRQLTPAGWQQVDWGVDERDILRDLDAAIVRRLQAKASWR